MTTFTWSGFFTPTDWTNGDNWNVGDILKAGVPGAGDTAIASGTISLEIPLNNIQVQMPASSGTSEILATDVDLGDRFQLATTNPQSNFGFIVYKVVNTGTLGDDNVPQGQQPQPGSMNYSVSPLTIDLASGALFIDHGTMTGTSLAIVADPGASGTFENDSTIEASGVFQLGVGATLTGSGVVNMDGTINGNADIRGAVTSGQTIQDINQPAGGTQRGGIILEDIASFHGNLVIDRPNTIFITGMNSAEKSYVGGVLTFQNGQTLNVGLGPHAGSISVVAGAGGTTVFAIACFAAGTGIATPEGDVAVETLMAGDRVKLAAGEDAEIVWVGHRRTDCSRHPKPEDAWPIRVRANAFAPGQPLRDLLLSPDHSVFVNDVLIPIRYLVNGATIVQERRSSIDYFHIELAAHDVILAEGLPVESYLDTGNRAAFANGGKVAMLHPDFAIATWEKQACARLVLSGPDLVAARQMLLHRAVALGYRRRRSPALRIFADGDELQPQTEGARLRVQIPEGAKTLRICSPVHLPAHFDAASDDCRRLGVALAGLALDGQGIALDDARMASGWHAPEQDFRWTDGDATLLVGGARVFACNLAMLPWTWMPAPAPGSTATG